MQVFWVSGPVGRIRSFNLSLKTVVLGAAVLALTLLLLGSVLQFLGFRMALEYDPQIARRLGNLHTALEVEHLNAVYHTKLGELEQAHDQLLAQVSEMEAAKATLMGLLPGTVSSALPRRPAQGGQYLPVASSSPGSPGSVLARIEHFQHTRQDNAQTLAQQLKHWNATIERLQALPVQLPVPAHRLSLSSGYGERQDPFTQRRALHAGLDFELPMGEPILAAGHGVVQEAGWDPQYGHTVVIGHANGHASRYAHASALRVTQGQNVRAGQVIALAGSSGRSTGPHLHFEVLKDGTPVDPAQYLLALQKR